MDNMLDIESLCTAIEASERVDNSTLVHFLCNEDKKVRLETNFRLACIYFYKRDDIKKALVYAQRAFMLSGVDEKYLNLYIEILHSVADFDGVRLVYKEIGCRFSEVGDVLSALRYFDLHRDVYANAGMGDRYEYDFDVLKRIRDLATAYRSKGPKISFPNFSKKIKIAYLVFGINHANSVIIKLLAQYAKYHDVKQFDVVFFIVESSKNNLEIENANIALLKSTGAKVVQTGSESKFKCLLEAAHKIIKFHPDILVSTAVLANYAHYFVFSLIQGVKKISYCYGPPEQYIPPDVDYVICPAIHPVIDSMIQPVVIPLEFDFSNTLTTKAVSRESIGIPNDAVIIVAAGRPSKFLNKEYWKAIFATLTTCDNAYFVGIGLTVIPPFFSELLPEQMKSRVKVFGWQDEYLKTLKLADIVIDTFPSGGGVVLLEAMANNIPVITFQEDFSCKYDQMNWNPGSEFVSEKEIVLTRWDFFALKEKLVELVNNRDIRLKLGALLGHEVRLKRGDPERYVRNCEFFFKNLKV